MASQKPKASAKKAPDMHPPSAAPAAAAAGAGANKPAPLAAPVLNPTSAPDAISAPQQPEQHGSGAAASGLAGASEVGPVTDLQKKLRRAERFGMPVQLSEEEKRSSRAERFGTGPTVSGSKNVGQVEEQKRKARAERFGLKLDTVADEEMKKKARLERFAPSSKIDSTEEEKRKARALRFSQGSSKVSGQANSELIYFKQGKSFACIDAPNPTLDEGLHIYCMFLGLRWQSHGKQLATQTL